MRTLLFSIFFVLAVCFNCLGQYTPITPTTTPNNNFNSQNYNCGSTPTPPLTLGSLTTGIEAPSSPSTPDYINCDAQVIYSAGTAVYLNPGFQAGTFTSGYFLTSVLPGGLNPVITVNGNATYAEDEFGIQLPSNIQTAITNFLSNPDSPPAGSINPYDPTKILIQVTFQQSGGSVYTRYSFYYQDVTPVSNPANYYPPTAQFTTTPDTYPFRIRFAPPAIGTWNITITPYYFPGGVQTLFANPFYGTFNVSTNSGLPGNVIKGNNWHFKFDNPPNSSKTTFFPVGQDIPWASITPAEEPTNSDFGWGSETDADFTTQRSYISNIAANNGNFVRLWMTAWSNGIENETPYNNGISNNNNTLPNYGSNAIPIPGIYNQAAAWELDKTLNTCEGNNVYALLTLQDAGNYLAYVGDQQWTYPGSPYRNYLISTNLYGPSPTIQDFFTDPGAIQYFENRLFYIEARWGYSANIAIWELMNETNETGMGAANGDEYSGNPTFQTDIAKWISTMYQYLHGSTYSMYPQHLVTTGYAEGPSSPHSSSSPGNDYSPEFLDVLESHHYTDETSYADMGNRFQYYYGSDFNGKPCILGEVGSGCGNIDNCSDKQWHNLAWSSAFTSSGSGLNWNDEAQVNGINHRNNFNFFNSFFSTIDFEKNQFSQSSTYESQTSQSVELEYFQDATSGQHYRIGWIHDINDGWGYDVYGSGCNNLASQCSDIPTTRPTDLSITPNVTFDNLASNTNYTVTVYNTNGHTGSVSYSEYSFLGSFPLSLSFSWSNPDCVFLLTDGTFQSGNAYALAVKQKSNNDTVILPNDTVYLSKDSLHYPGNNRPGGYYAWNFGNGQTSTLINPAWRYSYIGNYLLSVHYSDLTDSIHHFIKQTYVVLDTASKPQITSVNPVTGELNGLTLVPNPTNGNFTVTIENNHPIETIEIFDMSGKLCYQKYSPKSNVFDISGFSSGMYLVKVMSGSKMYYKKLIKE